MTKPTIDDLLTRSAPATPESEPRVDAALRLAVAESREAGRTSRRPARARLWWLAVPAVLVPAIAIGTSGAIDARQVPDLTIPISYTTTSGEAVSCSLDFFNGEMLYVEVSTAAVDHLRAQNWDGVGQRIHDSALALTTDPAWLGSEMNSDGPDAAARPWRAWIIAVDEAVLDQVPGETMAEGTGGLGSSTDCTGRL